MGENNSKISKKIQQNENCIPFQNFNEKKSKSQEYLKLYNEAIDKYSKRELIEEAININNIDKDIVLEYLKTIKNESYYKNELLKYQVLFTPNEIKSYNFPITKIKSEKEKLIGFFEEIFNIDIEEKDKLNNFFMRLTNEHKNIIHFNLPISNQNNELYYYKNYCLLLERFKCLDNFYNRTVYIKNLQKYKNKIKDLFNYLDNISEKMQDFIFISIFIINDYGSFDDCYFRVVDSFIKENDIQNVLNDYKKKNELYEFFTFEYNEKLNKFSIIKNNNTYFELDNFSDYSPNIIMSKLTFFNNKFILKDEDKIASLKFIKFYESKFYNDNKNRIYSNFKKIFSSNIIKLSLRFIHQKTTDSFIENFVNDIINSKIIEKYVDIYPFDAQLGITDKFSMKVFLKGIIKFPDTLEFDENKIQLIKTLYIDAYFNVLFIHEFCGHFVFINLYYLCNTNNPFYSPRLKIYDVFIAESGMQMEYLLFGKIINYLSFSEIIYLVNELSYSKESILLFKEEFQNLIFHENSFKEFKGDYEIDINELIELNKFFYRTNIVFSLKHYNNNFEIGFCSSLFRH